MSEFRWCRECDTHHWESDRCYPEWEAWDDDEQFGTKDEPLKIRALDAQAAAEKAAELDDVQSAEYGIVGGNFVPTLFMRSPETGEVERFEVYGELVPSYNARLLPDEEE